MYLIPAQRDINAYVLYKTLVQHQLDRMSPAAHFEGAAESNLTVDRTNMVVTRHPSLLIYVDISFFCRPV